MVRWTLKALVILLVAALATGLLAGCAKRATPVPTPSPTATVLIQPMIRLEPPAGEPGTSITVLGSGWPPATPVRLYAGSSQALAIQANALQEVVPDSAGRFSAQMIAPLFEIWDRGMDWFVVARAQEGRYNAYGVFSIPDPRPTLPSQLTATPTPQAIRLEGSIQGMDLGTRTLGMTATDGRPYLVTLSDASILVDLDGQPVAVTDITLGAHVVVEGFLSPGGAVSVTRMILSLRLPTPTPSVSPTATPADGWAAAYFSNDSLLGTPALRRVDDNIDFDWGRDAPDATLPADHFSARWTRTQSFKAGRYRFYAKADDGVRVWLGDRLLIDEWREAPVTTYEEDVYLTAGQYALKVDYFEAEGEGAIAFWWESIDAFTDWKSEYFNNMSLSGDPALIRNDVNIDFDWGDGSPAEEINADRFSVRWRRVLEFEPGTYRFFVFVDDGIRAWVAGENIFDRWHDNDAGPYQFDIELADQAYEILVEYFDNGGRAQIHFWWEELPDETPTATITMTPTPTRSATRRSTPTPTLTLSFTPTITGTPTGTATRPPDTSTPTAAPSTPTATLTPTEMVVLPPTPTPTPTLSPLPDLALRAVTIQFETVGPCYEPGAPLGIRVEIENIGAADAGPFIVEVNGVQRLVPEGLLAGRMISLWFAEYRYPDANSVLIDATAMVQESDEGNNNLSQPLPIPTPPPVCSPTPTSSP